VSTSSERQLVHALTPCGRSWQSSGARLTRTGQLAVDGPPECTRTRASDDPPTPRSNHLRQDISQPSSIAFQTNLSTLIFNDQILDDITPPLSFPTNEMKRTNKMNQSQIASAPGGTSLG
jgi:hypothetical protein